MLFLETVTEKQPSPVVNPENQILFGIFPSSTSGLTAGIMSGKAFCSFSDKPKLSDAFIDNIFLIRLR